MRTLISLIAISLFAVSLIPSSSVSADNTLVVQAVITTGVTSSARPQTDNLSIIDHTIGTVTFFTEINGLNGQTIEHKWFYLDQEVSSITMQIGSGNSLNWSRSSVAPSQLGTWEAQVLDSNGRVLATRQFDVVESNRGVRQVMQKQAVDSCSVKLADLRVQMEEHPDVDYYKFLYEKQAVRCSVDQRRYLQE